MINQARKEGLDITACVYPYDFWATYIDSARFEPGWQDRLESAMKICKLAEQILELQRIPLISIGHNIYW